MKNSIFLTIIRRAFLSLLFFICAWPLFGQLVYNESFNTPVNTRTLPLGWTQGQFGPSIDPDNYWERCVSGNFPVIFPHTGSGMVRFKSWSSNTGESSYMASKRLDMRLMPAGGSTCSFWMYRDNQWATNNDQVQVFLNSTPNMAGTPTGPLLESVSGEDSIHRSCFMNPVPASCNGWFQYSFNIPQLPYNTANCYIVILATSAFGNDIHIDDFSVTTWPQNQSYTSSSAVVYYQNNLPTGPGLTNQTILGCRVDMNGAASPRTLTSMQFNTNGSNNPSTDISNAKLWFSGGNSDFNIENAILLGTYNQPWVTNDTFLTVTANPNYTGLTSFNGLEHGDNYFWLSYDIAPTAISDHFVDAEWINLNISGTGNITPNPSSLNGSRWIDQVYCQPDYYMGCVAFGYNIGYINSVILTGNNSPIPGISNNMNWVYSSPVGYGCPGPFPRFCPFQSHPPDYELFQEAPGKTTSLTANNLTSYPISVQASYYPTGNCNAAWIDYNKDGTFNNWFYEVSLAATGVSGSNVITLTGVIHHPGWRNGMSVSGTGIAPGATVVNASFATVTLSLNNIGAVSGNILFTALDGEKISQSYGLGANGTYTTNFRVPFGAVFGKTRLRVRDSWIHYNIEPCGMLPFGEAEDYIVTIVPDCPGYPGYTTWLGLTDNWNDPTNWCPPVAPISTNPIVNVRIPGGPTGAYIYKHPRIKAGVLARANKLRIEGNDTLFIDATTASSLIVQDSLKILTNTSALIINTSNADSAQVFNGLLTRPAESPLNASTRSRSFWLFTQTELSTQGMSSNDIITNIKLHLQRKSNGNPYKNVIVQMYYCAAGFNFTSGGAGTPPVPLATPVTVWSGDLNTSNYIGSINGWGTVDLLLATPFRWSGATNQLVVEMCYDNTGFPGTGADDESRFTQTGSFRRYMCIESLSSYPKAACLMVPGDFSIVNASGSVGSNIITVNAAQASLIYPGQLAVGTGVPGRQVVSIAGNLVTLNANASTNFANQPITFYNASNTTTVYRPNITFKFDRYYIKYPISIGGHWENNGTFIPANSRVTMNGTIIDQKISGFSNTAFYDLSISNSNHVKLMTDFSVTDSLQLLSGRLKLNNGMVTITNPSSSAITRTSGFIQAETDAITGNIFPYGRLRWMMSTNTNIHIIPFANTANNPIFLDYKPDSGTHDVIFGTYATFPNNTNLPLPEVTNIYGFDGFTWNSNGTCLVDRFYMIKDTLSISPQADITLRYAQTERSAANLLGMFNMSAQRWLNSTDRWEFPFVSGQTYLAGPPDVVSIPDFTGFNSNYWWTIVGTNTPLPVSVVDFTGTPLKDKVQLRWTTASEINNNYFEIERTVNHSDYDFIARTESKGPGSNLHDYEAWDLHPVEGIQYYYLRQYDFDGSVESFGPVSATYKFDLFEIVTAFISSANNQVDVIFNYDSYEPVNVLILDMTGRVVISEKRHPATPGSNIIELKTQLAQGPYQLIIQNSEKMVSRKLFY